MNTSYSSRGNLLKQRLSYKDKIKNNNEWGKENLNAIFSQVNRPQGPNYERMKSNYLLMNNVLTKEDIIRECSDFFHETIGHSEVVELSAYNKLPNKINVLLGEFHNRPFNFGVIAINDDALNSMLKRKDDEVKHKLYSKVNSIAEKSFELASSGQQLTEEQTKQLQQEIEAELKKYKSNSDFMSAEMNDYQDKKEMLYSNILKYIVHKEKLKDGKIIESLKHALISGDIKMAVYEAGGQLQIDVLNPLNVVEIKSSEEMMTEKGEAAGYTTYLPLNEVLETLGDYMSPEHIKDLEERYSYYGNVENPREMNYYRDDFNYLTGNKADGSYGGIDAENMIEINHGEWRSQKKVYFLKQVDFTTGEVIREDIVPEDFPIPHYSERITLKTASGNSIKVITFDDMSLEEAWIGEIWEGYIIDGDKYAKIQPKTYQLRNLDDPNDLNLFIHGMTLSNLNAPSVSLVDRAKPFIYMYMITYMKLKRLIARDKGQVFHLDVSMIPEKLGLERAMYYLNELDIDLFNPLQNAETPGAYQRGKITGSTSRSNMQYITNYIGLLDAIDNQISDICGIPKGREGQTHTRQAVTTAQQDLVQSANVTEVAYILPIYRVWESILNTSLSLAVELFSNKRVLKQYVLGDMSSALLDIKSEDLVSTEAYGVFVSNLSKEHQVFKTLQNLYGEFVRSGNASMQELVRVMKADNLQELENFLEKNKIDQQELTNQEKQHQQQIEQMKIDAAKEAVLMEQKFQEKMKVLEAETKLRVAEINAFKFQQDQDKNNNNVPDQLEIEKFKHQKEMDKAKLKIENKKLDVVNSSMSKAISSKKESKTNKKK